MDTTPYLVDRVEVWGEAAVHAEDALVHNGGNGQAVEAVRERLPQLDAIPVGAKEGEGGRCGMRMMISIQS